MTLTIFAERTNKRKNMHFVLSYNLEASGERLTEIKKQIEDILSPYQHVERLSTFYIIHVDLASEWDTILSRLADLSKKIPERLHFIMSPTMPSDSSRYNGILPRGEWDEVNSISSL
jgi:hypothetical protein